MGMCPKSTNRKRIIILMANKSGECEGLIDVPFCAQYPCIDASSSSRAPNDTDEVVVSVPFTVIPEWRRSRVRARPRSVTKSSLFVIDAGKSAVLEVHCDFRCMSPLRS